MVFSKMWAYLGFILIICVSNASCAVVGKTEKPPVAAAPGVDDKKGVIVGPPMPPVTARPFIQIKIDLGQAGIRNATLKKGSDCEANGCLVEGYCRDYWFCEAIEVPDAPPFLPVTEDVPGKWKHLQCDEDDGQGGGLYWNPKDTHHFDGTCDIWSNLNEEVQETYSRDPECHKPNCYWKPGNGDCSNTYKYFHLEKTNGHEVEIWCPNITNSQPLIWDQARKSCHRCQTVKDANGHHCCGRHTTHVTTLP